MYASLGFTSLTGLREIVESNTIPRHVRARLAALDVPNQPRYNDMRILPTGQVIIHEIPPEEGTEEGTEAAPLELLLNRFTQVDGRQRAEVINELYNNSRLMQRLMEHASLATINRRLLPE